jgi:hypothetical protein
MGLLIRSLIVGKQNMRKIQTPMHVNPERQFGWSGLSHYRIDSLVLPESGERGFF